MANVSFHSGARADYDDALVWYAARDSAAADGFEREVEHAVGTLAAFPEIGAPTDDRHRYWSLQKYPFGLVYRIEAGDVLVVAVPHHRQRPGYWNRRV